MTVQEKLLQLSRSIEAQMQSYRNQIQDLMDEAKEAEEEINIAERGMYINMVCVMEEIAPEAPCFYDLLQTTVSLQEIDRSSLDFFFDCCSEQLAEMYES